MKRKSLILVPSLMLLLAPGLSKGSALVAKNEQKGEITFFTQLIYRGKALTEALARASSLEIATLWNESRGTVRYRGRDYRAKFVISQVVDRYHRHPDSGSCAENVVQIEQPAQAGDRSFYAMSGRFGTFYTSDDLGRSSTAAHEYGHGLGLDHDDLDQRNASVPGIMFARGTLVRPEFQWNPLAGAGAPGGSIKPHHRKVRAVDLQKINLDQVNFAGGVGCLGSGILRAVRVAEVVKPEPRMRLELNLHEGYLSPEISEELESEAHDH